MREPHREDPASEVAGSLLTAAESAPGKKTGEILKAGADHVPKGLCPQKEATSGAGQNGNSARTLVSILFPALSV